MSDSDKLKLLQTQMAEHKKLCAQCHKANLKVDQYCDFGYVIARAHHQIKRRVEQAAAAAALGQPMLDGMAELGR